MAWKLLFSILFLVNFYSCTSISPLKQRLTSSLKKPKTQKNLKKISKESPEILSSSHRRVFINEKNKKKYIHKEKKSIVQVVPKIESSVLKKNKVYKNEDITKSYEKRAPEFKLGYKKKHYDFWISYFTHRDKARFKRHVKNSLAFKNVVEKILEAEGLPKELFYVGLIESGFNTHIRSKASAVGPWQFIKGTALRYGLSVDKQLDERRNIFKSTLAAANYFKDLYNIFGSWELALCAYNAGEYRIINAIRKGNTRDYMSLVSKRLIPKETIYYIPKVMAAKTLYSGISKRLTNSDSNLYKKAHELKLYQSFSLKSLSRKTKISRKTLKKLNPDIRWDFVGKRKKGFRLFVPKSKQEVVAKLFKNVKGTYTTKKNSYLSHYVKKGESLYKVARKYKTTIKKIKKINKLTKNKIFRGQKLRVPGRDSKIYVVKRGDNLFQIAKRFGLSVRRLVKVNNLTKKTIYPKQKIILPI